jgi:maintenance of morphology protein 1
MSLFSMTPTFTQGLVVGQLSILLLLGVIIRHLFLDSGKTQPVHTPAPLPVRPQSQESEKAKIDEGDWRTGDAETAEWFNLLLNLVSALLILEILSLDSHAHAVPSAYKRTAKS